VGEHIYLKVSPLHVKGKLSPRYVCPYPIVKRIGKVTYKLELPPELTGVHPVFHVPQLQKCVVVEKRVPAQALDVQRPWNTWSTITPSTKQRGRRSP
jgi:hypothetical protein